MADKRTTKKRRVAVERQAEARRLAVARRERRRRLLVGGVVGFLALALIAPLTAGLLLTGSDDDDLDTIEPATTTTRPPLPWVDESRAGAALEGPTPCPDTDGTAERTTSFTSAPPQCIAEDSTHELTFTTADTTFSLPVDASLAPEAANLAVTFAHYRTYEQTVATTFLEGGMLWIGGDGDTGFTIPGELAESDDPYPVGSVLLVADLDAGDLDGVIVVVLDEAASAFLAGDPRHVVVGMVDDVEPLKDLADASIIEVTATETG